MSAPCPKTTMMARALITCLCFQSVETLTSNRALAADYYLSAAGDDAREGSSPETAWATIARGNRQLLRPGDKLLFRGGDAFDGNLVVKISRTPSAKSPITIGSYGKGRATIRAGNGTGIFVKDSGGVVIRDLIIESKNRRTNQGSGLSIINCLPGARQLEFVRVENVEARGFGKYGIAVGGDPVDNSRSGFRDVRITGCRASDNAYVGIHVYGKHDYYAKSYSNRDVAVVDCIAHDNPGDPDFLDNHSGNGILLHDVDGGLIDGCTAYGNGSLCRAKAGGPVGIWAWSARKLVIQNCVSVRNRTGGNYDGGGFDFDGGVSESIMQYNYSAENDGAGYLVFDFGAAPFRLADNIVRFNISENDGRKNGFAGIFVKSVGEPMERLQVFHNTIFVSPPAAKDRPAAVFIENTKDCRVHNNLLITAPSPLPGALGHSPGGRGRGEGGGCPLIDIGKDQIGLCIQGNHYWAAHGSFLIRQAGSEFSSLADWRKHTGMEKLNDKDVGSAGDPVVTALRGEIITDAAKRTTLDRYRLRNQSPLIRSGLDLRSLYHINLGERDFWGNPLPKDTAPAIGADAGKN